MYSLSRLEISAYLLRFMDLTSHNSAQEERDLEQFMSQRFQVKKW